MATGSLPPSAPVSPLCQVDPEAHWYPRKSGRSKFGVGRFLSAIADIIVLKFEMTFLERPLQFFGLIGFLLFCFGFIFDACLVFLLNIFASGTRLVEEMPKLLFGVLMMIAGLQLFSIGLLGEMLVSFTKRMMRERL